MYKALKKGVGNSRKCIKIVLHMRWTKNFQHLIKMRDQFGVVFPDPTVEVFGGDADLPFVGRSGGVEFEFADIELDRFIVDKAKIFAQNRVVLKHAL